MRLIKLKIKNIASLKGDHLIDFAFIQNQSPLFAITGETGAGKSSILNAIGMALYGKVYKSNVNQNDLVTLGEKEGQIELIFQSKGKSYLAFWKTRIRKQNGELYSTPQTPQRELYNLEGIEFDSPKTILTTKTEELLNLDFDQFCKCIILNQGEFAKFLTSSFTERKEILEKLYPGELLDSLSAELKKEKEVLEKQISDIDIELHTLKGDGPDGSELIVLKTKLEEDFKLHDSWLGHIESMEYHFISLRTYRSKYGETQSKIESVKQTLSKETSSLNELLVLAQKSSEELKIAQAEQESTLPKLQELLKDEESLRNHTNQLQQIMKSLETSGQQLHSLRETNKELSVKKTNWTNEFEQALSSFSYPVDELKKGQKVIGEVIDLWPKLELIEQDLKTKLERSLQLEVQLKEEAAEISLIQERKRSLYHDPSTLEELKKRKMVIEGEKAELQRALILQESTAAKIKELKKILDDESRKAKINQSLLSTYQQDYLPLKTTLKLQDLVTAVEICLTHPSLDESQECPVCHSKLTEQSIYELKSTLTKTDFSRLKVKEAELERLIISTESEIKQGEILFNKTQHECNQKVAELESIHKRFEQKVPSTEDIEKELEETQKKAWELEKLSKDEDRLKQNEIKISEQLTILRSDIDSKSKTKQHWQGLILEYNNQLMFLGSIDADKIKILNDESRKLNHLSEFQAIGEKLDQELSFIKEKTNELSSSTQTLNLQKSEIESKNNILKHRLQTELNGKLASTQIAAINSMVKEKLDLSSARERELKVQELKLKESQSRLYTLDEHIKEIDFQFSKEIHTLRDLSQISLPRIYPELSTLTDKLGTLSLSTSDPLELFLTLSDFIEKQKFFFKAKTSELKMNFAAVRTKLEEWDKRQDRILILKLKSQDLLNLLNRRSRLYEVLGKDELRTFVLSLVEENLISQTNDELQKLCNGRYEIVHQSKRMKLTPEFYILDKFRDGGLRKVSTLSGGETFMVSLAMALGLAEMTRGKAEIDTLFIDEGFGTLDHESLEDILDMLKQIQTRGLMVGIISHIKVLTQALPINLLVAKKQDGTSALGIVYN
jgi:exonuclease SbcC